MQRYGLQDLHLSRAGWCSVSLRDMPPYWALKRPGKPLWCSSVSAPIQRQRALPGRNSSRVGRAFAVVRAAAIGPWPMAAALSPLEDWICRQGGLGTPAEWTVCGGKDGMRGRILRSFLQARPMHGRCKRKSQKPAADRYKPRNLGQSLWIQGNSVVETIGEMLYHQERANLQYRRFQEHVGHRPG